MQAFHVFIRMMRQWHIGHGGPVGLRLEALPIALRLENVARKHWAEVADGVAIMEGEALRLFANRSAAHG